MTLAAKFCRVYFNRGERPSKAWSVDFGKNTCELVGASVLLKGPKGEARFDPPAGDGAGPGGSDIFSPRAWFEFTDVVLNISFGIDGAVIEVRPQ